MFVRAKGPCKLRGKGAEIKGFGAILLLVWNEFKNHALENHRMITAMLKLNVEMEKILAENKCYDAFPPMPAKRFHDCANQMAHIQCLLYDRFVDEPGPTLFGVTSKLHSVVHIASLAAFLNPQGLVLCRRRLHECLQDSLQTMRPWSKASPCTSQDDGPFSSRNALPDVAID